MNLDSKIDEPNSLLKITLGEHILSLYNKETELHETLTNLYRISLERNLICLYLSCDVDIERFQKYLSKEYDLLNNENRNGIRFFNCNDVFIKSNQMNSDKLTDFMKTQEKKVIDEGFNGLLLLYNPVCISSESPMINELVKFESNINLEVPGCKSIIVCFLREEDYEPEQLLDFISSHPKIIVNSILHQNLYYISPDLSLAKSSGEVSSEVYKRVMNDIIYREKAFRDRRLEQNRANQYLDIAGVMIVSLGKNGNVSLINQKGCEILGYEKEEIIGKNWFDNFIPKSLRNDIKKVFKKVISGEIESVRKTSNPVLTKNNVERDIEWFNSIIKNEKGEIIGSLSSGNDVTIRNQLDKIARKQNQFLNTVINSFQHPFYVINCNDYRIVLSNKKEIRNLDSSEHLSCFSYTHNSTEPCSVEICPIHLIKETKEPVILEHTHYEEDGSPIYVEIHASPIFDKNGEVVQIIENVMDVTERIESAKIIEEKQKKLNLIFENVNDGIVFLDQNMNFVEVNSVVCDRYGYSKEEFLSIGLHQIYPEEKREFAESKFRKVLEEGFSIFETTHVNSKGSLLPVEISARTVLYNSQPAILSIIRDISERKRSELEIQETEMKYSLLFKEMLNAFAYHRMIYDKKGNPIDYIFLEINNNFEEFTGLKRDEILGKKITEIFPDIYQLEPNLIEIYGQVAKTGEAIDLEVYFDSLEKWFYISAYSPRRDYFAVLFMDITEKKRSEYRLGERVKELTVLNSATRIVMESEESTDDTIAKVVNLIPSGWQYTSSTAARISIGGKTFKTSNFKETNWKQKADITYENVKYGEVEVFYLEEKTDGFEGPFLKEERDLIESLAQLISLYYTKKKILEELSRSEERNKELIETMTEGFGIEDKNGIITYANDKLCDIFGYTQEEILGKPTLDFLIEESKQVFIEQMKDRKHGVTRPYEVGWQRKDGTVSYTLISPKSLQSSKGEFEGSIAVVTDITKRKQAEEDLLRSEERLAEAQRVASLGNWDWDIIKNDLYWSDEIYRIFGCTPLEFGATYEAFMSFVHPDDRDFVDQQVQLALQDVGDYNIDHRIVMKNGSVRDVNEQAQVVFDNEGKPIRMIGTVQDITYRKRTEEALKELSEQLEEKVEQRTSQIEISYSLIRELSYTYDLKEALRIIANYVKQLVDCDLIVDIISKEGVNLYHVDIPDISEVNLQKIMVPIQDTFHRLNPYISKNRNEYIVERRKEKELSDIKSFLTIPLIAESDIVGIIYAGSEKENAFSEDEIWFLYRIADNITQTLQKMKVIISAKEELETVIEHTSDGLVLLNAEKQIILANRVGRNFLEKIGFNLGEFFDFEAICFDKNDSDTRKEIMIEEVILVFAVAQIKTDYLDGWLLTFHDVTEERKMQLRIMQQDRLATIGQLSGGIAHDFNNLLASVIGAADLALYEEDEEEKQQFLNLIIRQSERGASLIRQMLDFSRQTLVLPKVIDVQDFFNEFTNVIRAILPENIVLDIYSEDALICMDSLQLQQLLMNLVLNSKDAMSNSGKITLSANSVHHSKVRDWEDILPEEKIDYVHFIVEDSGNGINELDLKRVFEPFFTTKEVGKGSGLGLAQVYGIVRQSNSHILIESEVDKGTTVHLYIPQYYGEVSKEIEDVIEIGKGNVLLAEDNDDVRKIYTSILEKYGFSVVSVSNGEDALAIIDDQIDLLITDIVMPKMGGEELIIQLRDKKPKLKFLAITGYSDITIPDDVTVVQKPISASKLISFAKKAIVSVEK